MVIDANSEKINASPTKEFFIDMLTRDISLDRALLDLVDNSVDAALSNGIKKPEIRLEITETQFVIEDNCGGIPFETAKNYAFRFGRPAERESTPFSVGQFGVGMKRTLFKLGRKFSVQSSHASEPFRINVDVDSWKSMKDWFFDFDKDGMEIKDGTTRICVSDLYDSVSEQFSLSNFINSLSNECSEAHFKALNNGLKIFINGNQVNKFELKFKSSDLLRPIQKVLNIHNVKVTLIAGVSERVLSKGGWYIVCNGRLVAAAEQSSVTGWQVDGVPKYHPDFAFFRGLVEFESTESKLLPWTTTKTGVDKDNPIFKRVVVEMKKSMKEVVAFLRLRATEDKDFKESLLDDKPLNNSIENSFEKAISELVHSDRFLFPTPAIKKDAPSETIIQYKVSIDKIEKVKESLGVSANYQVGQETFDYYFRYECEE